MLEMKTGELRKFKNLSKFVLIYKESYSVFSRGNPCKVTKSPEKHSAIGNFALKEFYIKTSIKEANIIGNYKQL